MSGTSDEPRVLDVGTLGISPAEESLGFLLGEATRLGRRLVTEHFDGQVLPMSQMKALLYMARNPGIRQVDLADLLEVKPMSLVRVIDQLVALGYVVRKPHPTDRRAMQLFLTESAGPLVLSFKPVSAQYQQMVLAGFSDEEAAQLLKYLNRVRINLIQRLADSIESKA